jgi:predicted aspartyl protease
VTARFRYDESADPPAPVVPLRISHPRSRDAGVVVTALVDSGADCTCIPEAIATRLRLPVVDLADVEGFGGSRNRVRIHAARIQVATIRLLVRVVALENEAIVGRDVLAHCVVTLDGLRGVTTFRAPR